MHEIAGVQNPTPLHMEHERKNGHVPGCGICLHAIVIDAQGSELRQEMDEIEATMLVAPPRAREIAVEDLPIASLLLHAGVLGDLGPLGEVGRDHLADFRGRADVDLRTLGSKPPRGFR